MYKLNNLTAWVDICTYCNAKCPQCHRTNKSNLNKEDWVPLLQWDLSCFKKAFPISDLVKYSKFELCGTWGDPMLNKDIYDIVSYIINNSDCRVHINTNGSVRDPDFWWNFGVLGGKRVEVWFAVEGIDNDMHTLYRVGTNLEIIKDNIQAYTSAGGLASIFTVVFKHNYNYLDDIFSMCKSWGVNGSHFYTKSDRFWNGPSHNYYINNKKYTLEAAND